MPINMSNFWDSNYYNNPPLTDEMIKIAEKELGVELPRSFIELLKYQNGGYTKRFVFPMKRKTSWADNHVPLSELFGIVVDKESDSGHNIMCSEYMISEWELPEKQVLLNGDGHWWITLDYRNGPIPTISWIDTECEEDIQIADSFDSFIDGLVAEKDFDFE